MTANYIIQYSLVGIILLGAAAWLFYKTLSKKGKKNSCCGCALSDACNKKESISKIKDKRECNEKDKSLE